MYHIDKINIPKLKLVLLFFGNLILPIKYICIYIIIKWEIQPQLYYNHPSDKAIFAFQ